MKRTLCIALAAWMMLEPAAATAQELGAAGLLSRSNREDLPEITLGVGQPLLEEGELTLRSGGYYRINLTADGTGELAIEGPGFFRAVWVNEVVINDIEIRPFGISSLEFDGPGTAEITFVAIQPGSFELAIPGARGDSQRVRITIQ
jgi:hypothetical protein